jgi:hypothetical protein
MKSKALFLFIGLAPVLCLGVALSEPSECSEPRVRICRVCVFATTTASKQANARFKCLFCGIMTVPFQRFGIIKFFKFTYFVGCVKIG